MKSQSMGWLRIHSAAVISCIVVMMQSGLAAQMPGDHAILPG
jgi:hypothetical protein